MYIPHCSVVSHMCISRSDVHWAKSDHCKTQDNTTYPGSTDSSPSYGLPGGIIGLFTLQTTMSTHHKPPVLVNYPQRMRMEDMRWEN